MNKTITLAVLAMLVAQSMQAQIKRQYKDNKHAQETVVVKDKASTSDIDILNSQFDIDDIAVGEVIRITTETDPTKKALPEQPVQENTVAMLNKPKQQKAKVPQQKVVKQPAKVEVSPTAKPKERYRGIYPRKSKITLSNPRFKKKKRKRTKRSKKKCYRF